MWGAWGENIVASTQFHIHYSCRRITLLICLSEVYLAEHSYDIKTGILRISGPNLPPEVGQTLCLFFATPYLSGILSVAFSANGLWTNGSPDHWMFGPLSSSYRYRIDTCIVLFEKERVTFLNCNINV